MTITTAPRVYPSKVYAENRAAVMDRDGGRCRYCGDVATCVDHVRPRSKGGTHDTDNMVAACFRCNARATNRLFRSFDEKRRTITRELDILDALRTPLRSE